jgi:hypothetical protein
MRTGGLKLHTIEEPRIMIALPICSQKDTNHPNKAAMNEPGNDAVSRRLDEE